MKLPRDPVTHSTLAEYFLACHARWAAMARLALRDDLLDSARLYGRMARGFYGDWHKSFAERGERGARL
jgi:hypothetical protein